MGRNPILGDRKESISISSLTAEAPAAVAVEVGTRERERFLTEKGKGYSDPPCQHRAKIQMLLNHLSELNISRINSSTSYLNLCYEKIFFVTLQVDSAFGGKSKSWGSTNRGR